MLAANIVNTSAIAFQNKYYQKRMLVAGQKFHISPTYIFKNILIIFYIVNKQKMST